MGFEPQKLVSSLNEKIYPSKRDLGSIIAIHYIIVLLMESRDILVFLKRVRTVYRKCMVSSLQPTVTRPLLISRSRYHNCMLSLISSVCVRLSLVRINSKTRSTIQLWVILIMLLFQATVVFSRRQSSTAILIKMDLERRNHHRLFCIEQ